MSATRRRVIYAAAAAMLSAAAWGVADATADLNDRRDACRAQGGVLVTERLHGEACAARIGGAR